MGITSSCYTSPMGGTRRIDASIDIDVPAAVAFAFLADPSTARIIDPAVRSYEPDELPMREGTRNTIRFRMWGLPVTATSSR